MSHYEIVLRWSVEDSVFVAEVPQLPGCFAHGADEETALANVKAVIDLWIDVTRRAGEPVPEPRARRTATA